jgi:hypothetical protein
MMIRALRGLFLAGIIGGAVAWAGLGLAADGTPCTIATKGDSPVAKACAEGGIEKAKKTMRELRAQAKKSEHKKTYECDDCHKDDVKYELTAGARDKFKQMLADAAAAPK